MKNKTFKTIITAIMIFFVFVSYSWAENKSYQRERTYQSDRYHHNYEKNNHYAYNNHRNKHKHKKWHQKHHYNKQNNTTCYSSRPKRVHLRNHFCFRPYRYIPSGVFHVPAWSFSFSTNGHW